MAAILSCLIMSEMQGGQYMNLLKIDPKSSMSGVQFSL